MGHRFDLTGLLPETPPGGKPSSLNGIVAGPGGHYLLSADMIRGGLYRLDPATGEAERVALHGGDLRNADGLEAAGDKLWAVHNTDNALSRWRLDRDGRAAHLERHESDPALQLPTTVAREHGTLYVVRSQFDKGGPMGPGTPQTPFTVAAVRGL